MADGSPVALADGSAKPARRSGRSLMRRGLFVVAVGPGDLAGVLRLLRRTAAATSPRLHSCLVLALGLDAGARAALAANYPRITLLDRAPADAGDLKSMLFADADLAGLVMPGSIHDRSASWDAAQPRIFGPDASPERIRRRLDAMIARSNPTEPGSSDADMIDAERSRFLDDVESGAVPLAGEARVFYGLEALHARPYRRADALKLAALAFRERMPRAALAAFERDGFGRGWGRAQAEYQFGRACRQTGDVVEAHRRLTMAARRDPRLGYGVACEIAEIAILDGSFGVATASLRRATAERPDEPRIAALAQRIDLRRDLALGRRRAARHAERVTHVAAYQTATGNAGDVLVPLAPRWALERATRRRLHWGPMHVHDVFGAEQIAYANETRGVMVGGGGLFIADSGHNGVSGWQWNVAIAALRRLEVPLVLAGVGYNRFYDQRAFDPVFADALAALVDRCAFVGIRNRGSMRALAALLPPELGKKLELHPCATTVLSRLLPRPAPNDAAPFVALNCALDRAGLRFAGGYDAFVREMAHAVRGIQLVAPVIYHAHSAGDATIRDDIAAAAGFAIPCVDLYRMTPDDIVAAYRKPALCIGMRGHAIMIPFGLGAPSISLISHPKLRFFLEDTGLTHTGLDADTTDLGERLAALATRILERRDAATAEVAVAQDRIWRRLVANNRRIGSAFGLPFNASLASPAVPPPVRS